METPRPGIRLLGLILGHNLRISQEAQLPGENLTRVEAAMRASIVRTHSYDVTLDLTSGDETFLSTTTVHFSASAGESTFIDAITNKVHSITLNGKTLDIAQVSDGVRIQLPHLRDKNELTIVADAKVGS